MSTLHQVALTLPQEVGISRYIIIAKENLQKIDGWLIFLMIPPVPVWIEHVRSAAHRTRFIFQLLLRSSHVGPNCSAALAAHHCDSAANRFAAHLYAAHSLFLLSASVSHH